VRREKQGQVGAEVEENVRPETVKKMQVEESVKSKLREIKEKKE
jgi:hypothetical protein